MKAARQRPIRIRRDIVPYEIAGHRHELSFRFSGSGPAWLLLHQGNMNATEMDGLMRRWAGSGTLIAPDLPGWGGSSALGPGATIESIADALDLALSALGLEHVVLYGTHTGALVATALAARHSRRVVALATNGFVLGATGSDAGERMTQTIPWSASGSHLLERWNRVRNWMMFYPWYEMRRATRQRFPVPSAAFTHQVMLNQLEAADPDTSTRAVFAFDSLRALRALQVPARIMAFDADGTADHVRQLCAAGNHPANVEVRLMADEARLLQAAQAFLLAHARDASLGRPRRTACERAGPGAMYLPAAREDLFAWQSTSAIGLPVVLLHDLGGSTAPHLALCERLCEAVPVLALDLPGHGRSAPCAGPTHLGEAWSPPAEARRRWSLDGVLARMHESIAAWLARVPRDGGPPAMNGRERRSRLPARASSSPPADGVLVAFGLSALLAAALKTHLTGRWTVIAVDPICPPAAQCAGLAERLFPVLPIDAIGSPWMRAWQIRRDARIFWPWYAGLPGNEPGTEIRIHPREIDREVLDLVRGAPCARDLARQLLAADLAVALAGCRIVATRGGTAARQCQAAGLEVARWLPDDPEQATSQLARYVRDLARKASTSAAMNGDAS